MGLIFLRGRSNIQLYKDINVFLCIYIYIFSIPINLIVYEGEIPPNSHMEGRGMQKFEEFPL